MELKPNDTTRGITTNAAISYKLVMFGDSITQFSFEPLFMGCKLLADYVRRMDVLNRGFGGYTSDHAKVILPSILSCEPLTRVLILFFGTNDAVEGSNHVPIDRYLKNMEEMINLVIGKLIKLIVIGPGIHDTYTYCNRTGVPLPIVSNIKYKQYSDQLSLVCKNLLVPYINIWSKLQHASGYTEEQLLNEDYPNLLDLITDGIHYTARAYEIVYKLIKTTIKDYYPELQSDALPLMFAESPDIDPNDIEGTIINRII